MGCASIPLVSEIREAVKERYSGLAKQLAVKPAAGASCGDEAGACCGGYAGDEAFRLFLGFLRGCDSRSSGLSTPAIMPVATRV